ncbi:MAG: FAD-binding protein [Fimbriimonas sp.]
MTGDWNWAGNYEYRGRIVTPKTVAELSEIVRSSSKVRALGTRHSFHDIADSEVIVSLANFQRVIETDVRGKQVTVEAGMNYATLGPLLEREGFAVANLASLPHISIVGACATGTHGSGVGNGTLSTSVAGFEFVNANGEIVEMWRGDEGFDGAVVSLGALGVVTQVTLDLVPAFEICQNVYENLPIATLEASFDEIVSGGYSVSLFTHWATDVVEQVWVKRRVDEPEWGGFGATPAPQKLHPIRSEPADNCTEQMGVAGPSYQRLPHFRPDRTPSAGAEIQSEYFVPRANAVEALGALRSIQDQFNSLLMVSEIRTIAADSLWLSGAYEQDTVGIHFTWKREEAAVQAVLGDIERALLPFGVRPHFAKVNRLRPDHLESVFPRLLDFRKLVAKHDRLGKFHNEYLEQTVLPLS